MLVEFHGLGFDLPPGWADVTDDMGPGSPPTLAKPDGAGVLQFSFGRHTGGADPGISPDDLVSRLTDFCQQNGIAGKPAPVAAGRMAAAYAASVVGDDFVAAWQLSNGRVVVLMTYVCDAQAAELEQELADARLVALTMSA